MKVSLSDHLLTNICFVIPHILCILILICQAFLGPLEERMVFHAAVNTTILRGGWGLWDKRHHSSVRAFTCSHCTHMVGMLEQHTENILWHFSSPSSPAWLRPSDSWYVVTSSSSSPFCFAFPSSQSLGEKDKYFPFKKPKVATRCCGDTSASSGSFSILPKVSDYLQLKSTYHCTGLGFTITKVGKQAVYHCYQKSVPIANPGWISFFPKRLLIYKYFMGIMFTSYQTWRSLCKVWAATQGVISRCNRSKLYPVFILTSTLLFREVSNLHR